MLANERQGRWRCRAELFGVEVPTARDAMDVRLLLTRGARVQAFAFAFGEALGSLHRGGT